jgi:hypothetical protein
VTISGADLLRDERTAIFNSDRTHRFLLKRKIRPGDTICLFIMLNPSTADGEKNDNTISRCIKFADLWGFSWMWACNIFSIRSTDPKALYQPGKINDPYNDLYIKAAVEVSDRVMCAWGNHGNRNRRGDQVFRMIRDETNKTPYSFGVTMPGKPEDSQPKHPLARGKNWIPYEAEIIAL